MPDHDVIVVGAGNAALAAAVSAREQGAARVLVLEKAPEELRGGNTHYSSGLLRFAYAKPQDLLPIVPDAERQIPNFFRDVEAYSAEQFRADLMRVTEGRSDPELSEILIGRSYDTVSWMAAQGITMEPALSLSGVRVGDRIKWSPAPSSARATRASGSPGAGSRSPGSAASRSATAPAWRGSCKIGAAASPASACRTPRASPR